MFGPVIERYFFRQLLILVGVVVLIAFAIGYGCARWTAKHHVKVTIEHRDDAR